MQTTVLADLIAGLARSSVARIDPHRFLSDVAIEIKRALGVAGVVFAVPSTGWVCGSDETAALLGETQQRDGRGPLATALCSSHPIVTPDQTRIGPPSLAALAGEVGLTSSTVVPVLAGDDVVGAVQLLGRVGLPLEEWHLDALGPVLPVLGARIVDLTEISRLRRRSFPQPRAERSAASQWPSRTPLARAVPELVTQELGVAVAEAVPMPRRESERPRSRRRRQV